MLFDAACAMRTYFESIGCPAKVYFGKVHLGTNLEELRVVWVPGEQDSIEPPLATQAQGALTAAEKAAFMYQSSNPRPVFTRWASADLHIWGFAGAGPMAVPQGQKTQEQKDYAVLDALVNSVIVALHKTASGYWRPRGGRNLDASLVARRGFGYILPIQLAVPVVEVFRFPCDGLGLGDYTWRGATLAAIDATVNMVSPTGPSGASSVINSVSFEVGPVGSGPTSP